MTIQDYILHTASRPYGVGGPLDDASAFLIGGTSRASAPRGAPLASSNRFPLVPSSPTRQAPPPITTSAQSRDWCYCPICRAVSSRTDTFIRHDPTPMCSGFFTLCPGGCGHPTGFCGRPACLRRALVRYDEPRRAS
jgi:hypothetical protein